MMVDKIQAGRDVCPAARGQIDRVGDIFIPPDRQVTVGHDLPGQVQVLPDGQLCISKRQKFTVVPQSIRIERDSRCRIPPLPRRDGPVIADVRTGGQIDLPFGLNVGSVGDASIAGYIHITL